jgi:hypothetical protein
VVQNVAKLFADDTKLYATVNNTNDEIKLQGDIDRLMQWSKDWLLTFNKSKCKRVITEMLNILDQFCGSSLNIFNLDGFLFIHN